MSDDELNDPLDVVGFFYTCDSIQNIGTSLPVASALLGILDDSCTFAGTTNFDNCVSSGEAIADGFLYAVGGGLISRLERSFLESTPTLSRDTNRSLLEGSIAGVGHTTTGQAAQSIASEQEASQNRVVNHWNQEETSRSHLFASPVGELPSIEASPSIPSAQNSLMETQTCRGHTSGSCGANKVGSAASKGVGQPTALPPVELWENTKGTKRLPVSMTATWNATEWGKSPSDMKSPSSVGLKELTTSMTNAVTSQRFGITLREKDNYLLPKLKRTRSASNGYSKTVWKKIAARTQLGENGKEEFLRSSLLEQASMNASTTFKTSGIKIIRKDSQSSNSSSNNTLGPSATIAESSTSFEAFSLPQQRVERSILRNSTSPILISMQKDFEEQPTNSALQHQESTGNHVQPNEWYQQEEPNTADGNSRVPSNTGLMLRTIPRRNAKEPNDHT